RLLAHLFPVLKRVDSIAELAKNPIGRLDSKQLRRRAFIAMKQLLVNISKSKPIVMFIDDLQWGDLDSANVLFEMLIDQTAPRLFLLGSYRQDEFD
ncbi:AAA family ATPase, partial [Klebsiella pneumoniae]|uniref:AAA family ATPase n=1 Tax=Klebsiella pneumoniae TaxID=573 RepID=UPI0021F7DD5E